MGQNFKSSRKIYADSFSLLFLSFDILKGIPELLRKLLLKCSLFVLPEIHLITNIANKTRDQVKVIKNWEFASLISENPLKTKPN